jgi:hypothetical protein
MTGGGQENSLTIAEVSPVPEVLQGFPCGRERLEGAGEVARAAWHRHPADDSWAGSLIVLHIFEPNGAKELIPEEVSVVRGDSDEVVQKQGSEES